MIEINANGLHITPSIVRQALAMLKLSGEKPAKCKTSPEQQKAWEDCSLVVQKISINPDDTEDVRIHAPTLAGYDIILNPEAPKDEVLFLAHDDNVVCVIRNLNFLAV